MALEALAREEYEYAGQLLPISTEEDFNEFLRIRHESNDKYKKYFWRGSLQRWQTV